jgi:hypothetical protein
VEVYPAYSDERAKQEAYARGVNQGLDMQDQAIGNLEGQLYEYKPEAQERIPGLPSGPQYGDMAQRMEQNPLTRQAIVDTPQGKAIDLPGWARASTGLIGRLGERDDELDARQRMLEADLDELIRMQQEGGMRADDRAKYGGR